jgi:hypothetical protein
MSVEGALEESLESTPHLPRDRVTVQLALRYAEALDDCFAALTGVEASEDAAAHARVILEITRLGARLEACLDRLGMSPGARPSIPNLGGERGQSPDTAALDQLRRDAAAGAPASGIDYAAGVDPSVAEADTEE